MGKGRSLRDNPNFSALAREYESRPASPLRRGDIAHVRHGSWYALKLEPGGECQAIDRIANHLRLPVFLPMEYGQPYRYRGGRGRWRQDCWPLFPGYGFVMLDKVEQHWSPLRSCPGVLGIITQANGSWVVFTEREIDACKARENGADKLIAAKLQAGQDELERRWRHECAMARKQCNPLPDRPGPDVIKQKHALTGFQNVTQFGSISVVHGRSAPLV